MATQESNSDTLIKVFFTDGSVQDFRAFPDTNFNVKDGVGSLWLKTGGWVVIPMVNVKYVLVVPADEYE